MERIKRPERTKKMERALFIIISKHEIPAYRQALNLIWYRAGRPSCGRA
jgi:hypothetical protein